MGGWYDTNGFVPGLTLGQYISGLARLGAATGDTAAHAKVARLVAGFGEFIRRAESPYAGPNVPRPHREWFDPLAAGIDVLPEKHAYSHTIVLSSGAQAYRPPRPTSRRPAAASPT